MESRIDSRSIVRSLLSPLAFLQYGVFVEYPPQFGQSTVLELPNTLSAEANRASDLSESSLLIGFLRKAL